MSILKTYVLWICHEFSQPLQYTIELGEEADLDNLASYLIQHDFAEVLPQDLTFCDYDSHETLPRSTSMEYVKENTSGEKPLVVRYPLSNKTIVANVQFLRSSEEIHLPHSTGSWQMLVDKCQERFKRLQKSDQLFFIKSEGDSEMWIDRPTVFNHEVQGPNDITIDLSIGIKGKKEYGEWGIEAILGKILQKKYPSFVHSFCTFDIDATLGTDPVFNTVELTHIAQDLEQILSAFNNQVETNESTSRSFINPLIINAVCKVKSRYQFTKPAVDEDFDGSRGYGNLDYVVYSRGRPVVLITVPKMDDLWDGIAKITVQLHTASEKFKPIGSSPPVTYGIVSTGEQWTFLRWSGPPEQPDIIISKPYYTFLGGDTESAKEVVSIIARMIESQASAIELEEQLVNTQAA